MNECYLELRNKTAHGKYFICEGCGKVYIEFKNLQFTFSKEEFVYFRNYFFNLDGNYWEKRNRKSLYNRKIMVPVGHKNITTLFNLHEIEELKFLFMISPLMFPNEFLESKEMKEEIIWN